jgi:hypothetical protein
MTVLMGAGCASRSAPAPAPVAVTVGGQAVNLQELTPADVAREVQVVPRGQQVFFQAPPIQTTKVIDLHRAGQELGISLGKVERIRFGYLFGVLDRSTGTMKHYVLFQSNFVEGANRYASVTVPDGRELTFTVSRAPDPCVPNCFPVIEALIVEVPEDALRASASTGLVLFITLDNGTLIKTSGLPAYVQGYLQVVDGYQTTS